ncbi:hypothetical protein PsorP6_011597 [Peronosclerospora sorghi]|uniref:Uncharacterized protein n=1 Tax=Peronosclerospora sorghi TaxID=230839 RepID=A0ACC0WK87_9STRA|nr:hypothetical protein PsorP6_011597 [Peronosclerospora sorghi]
MTDFGFTRDDQDDFAIESYRRAVEASERVFFKPESTPVTIEGRRGKINQEMFKTQPKKIPTLRSSLKKDGTITAANASTLNDGAAAMVLMTGAKSRELGVNPLARIRVSADAAQDPYVWYPHRGQPHPYFKERMLRLDVLPSVTVVAARVQ